MKHWLFNSQVSLACTLWLIHKSVLWLHLYCLDLIEPVYYSLIASLDSFHVHFLESCLSKFGFCHTLCLFVSNQMCLHEWVAAFMQRITLSGHVVWLCCGVSDSGAYNVPLSWREALHLLYQTGVSCVFGVFERKIMLRAIKLLICFRRIWDRVVFLLGVV